MRPRAGGVLAGDARCSDAACRTMFSGRTVFCRTMPALSACPAVPRSLDRCRSSGVTCRAAPSGEQRSGADGRFAPLPPSSPNKTECRFLRIARMGYAHFLFHNLNRNPSCPGVHSRCYTSIRQEEAAKRDGPIRFEQPTLPPDTANEPRRSHSSGVNGVFPIPRRALSRPGHCAGSNRQNGFSSREQPGFPRRPIVTAR